jgi:hypothetical protein
VFGIAEYYYCWVGRREGFAVEDVKARLKASFPEWRFLRSDTYRWWALRGPLPPDRINEDDAVDADTAAQLWMGLDRITQGQA